MNIWVCVYLCIHLFIAHGKSIVMTVFQTLKMWISLDGIYILWLAILFFYYLLLYYTRLASLALQAIWFCILCATLLILFKSVYVLTDYLPDISWMWYSSLHYGYDCVPSLPSLLLFILFPFLLFFFFQSLDQTQVLHAH